jgi:hypothetical protein
LDLLVDPINIPQEVLLILEEIIFYLILVIVIVYFILKLISALLQGCYLCIIVLFDVFRTHLLFDGALFAVHLLSEHLEFCLDCMCLRELVFKFGLNRSELFVNDVDLVLQLAQLGFDLDAWPRLE